MGGQTQFILGEDFDAEGFLADVKAAQKAVGESGEADAAHLQKLLTISRVLAYGGHAMIFAGVARTFGIVSALCLLAGALGVSTARCMNWTIIGHHVSHGGFDSLQKNHPGMLPSQYKRGVFATGLRRMVDWLDWMLPRAWDVEHNKMHHYYLSEDKDPDVVERNFERLHKMPLPMVVKYVSMIMWLFTWKASYYSPNTFKEMQLAQKDCWIARHWPRGADKTGPVTAFEFFMGPVECALRGDFLDVFFWPVFATQWTLVVLPMVALVLSPVLPPVALGTLGLWPFAVSWQTAAWRALAAALVADMLSNAHSFVIIACNHAGDDLFRFSTSCRAYTAEWFLRCLYASVNFETGNDFVDILYGWLNYQIEHHMFPDMTPLQYRKMQPLVKSLCKKHGVQYIQQNGFWRAWKMIRVAVGDEKMVPCEAVLPPKATERIAAAKVADELPEESKGA